MTRLLWSFLAKKLKLLVISGLIIVAVLKSVALLGSTVIVHWSSQHYPSFQDSRTIRLAEDKFQNAVNEEEIRFDKRHTHLRDACDRMKTEYQLGVSRGQCEERGLRSHLEYAEYSPLMFCAIEKTGCTFWARMLIVLGGKVNTTNPLDIKVEASYGRNKNFKSLTFDKIHKILRTKKKVLFVRDPYSRLLSGYIDKLFNPNPGYWKGMGSHIINSERLLGRGSPVTCGYNATFREFVSYFIKWIRKQDCIDGHFSESYRHCHPCEIDYDFIGKMESFRDDTVHILRKLNLSKMIHFEHFKESSDMDAINDAIDWLFGKRKESEKCVDFKVSMMKVWRRLQMRSIISRNVKFPFLNQNSSEVTKTEFRAEVEKAYADNSDLEGKKANRNEILREAYSTLSQEQVKELQKIFKVDLELFDYDPYPEFLRSDANFKPQFRYFSLDM